MSDRPKLHKHIRVASGELSDDDILLLNAKFPVKKKPKPPQAIAGPEGRRGRQGIPGPAGLDGADGDAGPAGADGADGADGLSIHQGTVNPPMTLGVDGESYINSNPGTLWLKENGRWNRTGNLIGPKGDKGPKGDDGKRGPPGPGGSRGPRGLPGTGGSGANNILTGYGPPPNDELIQGQSILFGSGPPSND